jgi:hypothetical protein
MNPVLQCVTVKPNILIAVSQQESQEAGRYDDVVGRNGLPFIWYVRWRMQSIIQWLT